MFIVLLMLGIVASCTAVAQLRDQGMSMGIGGGITQGITDITKNTSQYHARGFFRFPFAKALSGELGVGVGNMGGSEYMTHIIPVDYRFVLSPFGFDGVNPYLYAGAGGLHYTVKEKPEQPTSTKFDGWSALVPVGIGLQFKIVDGIAFEVSGGYNLTFNKNLNAILETKADSYITGLAGLTLYGESPNADPDADGLTNAEEKQLGTNSRVADSDGDGLKDGEETLKFKTAPLKADSDGDGLKDGQEVVTDKTDPNKADTDGDGLNDGEELSKYRTEPLKADTDGDGLNDGEEAMKYKTDPLKGDTDGDGLKDGEEAMKHKTDPLKADTDGGTVLDGAEIVRGSNALDPTDDVPKKEELKVEAGKAIILEGVQFESGKAAITPSSENVLQIALNTLVQNPDIAVEIRGYTDNVGKRASNLKLSQARADAVRAWLIAQGIAPERIAAKGLGQDNPISPNNTKEGKAKNRRIEFFRTK
jgi:outer membrane protein OmpA-like peptidoglycan-associated protein